MTHVLRWLTALLILLAGCASKTAGVTSTQPLPAYSAGGGTTLRVGLVEWQILTSARSVPAGTLTVVVTNAGSTSHDLHIRAAGVHVHTPRMSPGDVRTLRLTTSAGQQLRLTCDVAGHEAAGMHSVVTVVHSTPPSSAGRPPVGGSSLSG